MQVLGQEDGRAVDPPSLVIVGPIPLTLKAGKARFPIDVRNFIAEILICHNQEAPSLPVSPRWRLLRQLDTFEQHLTRNGTIEIQATANRPGCGQNMVDGCTVPSLLTRSSGFLVGKRATFVQS
jgi:hypothetical protein